MTSLATPAAPQARLPLRQLVLYGLPAIALAALNLPFFVYIPSFYGRELGLDLTAIGLILLAVRIIDAVSDPIIGALSDRWQPKLGRRRWLLLGLLPMIPSVWMVFVPPAGAGLTHLAVWSVVLSLSWTIMILPYTAWGAELSGDYAERNRIVGWREGLTLVGTLIATALPALAGSGAENAAKGLMWIAFFALLLAPPTILAAVRWVPEGPPVSVRRVSWREGLATLTSNRPFLRLLGAFLINGTANALPASLVVLYVAHVLQAPDIAGPILFTYFLAGMAGVPIWVALAKRWGKHRTWIASLVWAGVTFSATAFLGAGDVTAFFIISALSGLALGADMTLPASMQADVVDVDTAASGDQRTGLYFALWGMATKLALALAVGIAYPLLGAAGFDANGTNDPYALFVLTALYAILPVGLKLLAGLLIYGFPLDSRTHAALRAGIETRAGLRPAEASR